MPTIPVSTDQQRVRSEALPGARVQTDAPAEAFGAGPSAQRVAEASIQALGMGEKIALQQKEQADQAVHLEGDTKLSELQTSLQLKAMNMKGKDGINAPDVVQKGWQDGYEKIAEGMNNQAQKSALARSAQSRFMELNKSVLVHAQTEQNNFQDQLVQSSVDQSRNSAVLNAGDTDIVDANVEKTRAVMLDQAHRKGWDEAIYNEETTKAISPLHRDVIQARLDAGLDGPAKDYFEKNKASMTANDIAHAKNVIETQMVVAEGNNLFNDVLKTPGLKFADGTYNLERVKQSLKMPEDMSDTKKEALQNFIEHRTGEFNRNKNLRDQSLDREFMNKVYQARKDGVPLSEAIKLAPKYGSDLVDQATKAQAVGKVYAPSSASDPDTFINLWQNTYDGKGSRFDIDQAMKTGKINEGDWRSLREADYKAKTDGTDPLHKNAWERIKILSDEELGSNKKAKAKFMYDLHHEAENKSPEELIKMAKDKLEKDPSTSRWGFLQDRRYEADFKKIDAESLTMGMVHEDVGADVTNAIGTAITRSTGKPWGAKDIDQFAQTFGGYSAIKKGTEVNNAVISLQNAGRPVTPDNVKYLLKRYPNGIWK